MDNQALIRQFAPFMKNRNLGEEQLHNAYQARDKYGQHLPLPPRRVLMDEADRNKDGVLTYDELQHWKGYQGKSYCRNPGDFMYGCLQRCRGGIDHINGEPGYFESYHIEREDYPEDINPDQLSLEERYVGFYSKAQRHVIKHLVRSSVHSNVEGDIIHMGMKDLHSWRITFDTLIKEGDKNKKVHLVDPFTGFAQCDHNKDTGMCPLPGTSSPDLNELQSDISMYGDAHRIIIHRTHFDKVPNLPKIAVALVDGSLYPTVATMMKSLHGHLSGGAVVIVHDFGWEGYTGVERAVVDYVNTTAHNLKIYIPGSAYGVACYMAVLQKP